MTWLPSVDDLRLVQSVSETGSVGAAARRLGVSQPSASQRLALLERRCGATLFDRDTTGARPTRAGELLARQATHVLAHLQEMVAEAGGAFESRPLRVGTFGSLAAALFPSAEETLSEEVTPVVDYGPRLIEQVGEGTLDAAVVGVAGQVPLPRTVRAIELGEDRLVLLVMPGTAPPEGGRSPLRDRRVVYSTYDLRGPELQGRLERLGARAQPGPSIATTLAIARWRHVLAVAPRSALAHVSEGDVQDLPFDMRVRLALVTGRRADPRVSVLAAGLGPMLHLAGRGD